MLSYTFSKILGLFKNKLLLFLIFFIALGLRLWGITYGFPHIWNTDEHALIRSAYGLRFNLNPGHFDWPHFYYYVNGFLYFLVYSFRVVISKLGMQSFFELLFPLLYKDPTIFYLISRVLNAFVGAFTSIIIYKISKNMFSTKIALLSALLMAVLPYHVGQSHLALLEPALVLVMLLVFYYSLKIIDNPSLKNYVLAGVFIGLSTSIKYNGFLSAIVVILATLIAINNAENKSLAVKLIKYLILSAIVSVLIFFLTTPYALLDYKAFIRNDVTTGAFWQLENIGKTPINEYMPNLVKNLFYNIPNAVTYPIWVLSFIGFIFSLFRKNKKIVILGIFMYGYIFYTTTFSRQPMHYFLPIFTIIILLVSYFFSEILTNKVNKFLVKILVIVAVFVALLGSVKTSLKFANTDSRNLATDWITNNIQNGKVFLLGEHRPFVLNTQVKTDSANQLLTDQELFDKKPDYLIWVIPKGTDKQQAYYSKISDKIARVAYFSGQNNLGPNIYIYKILK